MSKVKTKRYVLENKDIRNMSLRDMESFSADKTRRRRNRIRNISLKYKIAISTILVALIPMIALGMLMIVFYNRAITERGERQITENISIMSDRIGSVLRNGVVSSNNLTIEISGLYNDRTIKNVTRNSNLYSQMTQALLIYDGIDSIVFIDYEGNFFTTRPEYHNIEPAVRSSDYVKTLKTASGKTLLMDVENNCMAIDEDHDIITLGKHVINIVTGEPLGYLFVNMNKGYLIESSKSEISDYLLYDTQNYCIYESNSQSDVVNDEQIRNNMPTFENKILDYNGDKYLIAKDTIKDYGWVIVGMTNLNKFNVTGRELLFILFITGGITIALLALSIIVTTSLVIRPLQQLHDGAEQIAEGDMSVRFHFDTKDEIGRLGRIFNYMTESNRELLIRVDHEARKKREYELSLIQEQVKPHFLYNTLDIIIMMIEMNRSRDAARVTHKLANYYKNSLSGSEEIVNVEREMEIIRDYLDLQTMRYGDKFSYNLDVDHDILDSKIPKMTLQPLVENAIYHGIKVKEGNGVITISGRQETMDDGSQCAVIVVKDDGVGVDDKTLSSLQDILHEKYDPTSNQNKDEINATHLTGSHFGLYSVSHRIKLYFGEQYGADIESAPGEGTKVLIRIPLLTVLVSEDEQS